jgi:hypothetical protein
MQRLPFSFSRKPTAENRGNAMTEDKLKHAKEQGQAQYDSIRELVAQLREDEDSDRAREAILEDALSVCVHSGWYEPGCDAGKPEEFGGATGRWSQMHSAYAVCQWSKSYRRPAIGCISSHLSQRWKAST